MRTALLAHHSHPSPWPITRTHRPGPSHTPSTATKLQGPPPPGCGALTGTGTAAPILAQADTELMAERDRVLAEWRKWQESKAGWEKEEKKGVDELLGAKLR